jgi:acyl-CoA thioesterase FadM
VLCEGDIRVAWVGCGSGKPARMPREVWATLEGNA